jgi:HEAT repeat protein
MVENKPEEPVQQEASGDTGFWSFMQYAFSFFGEVLNAVRRDLSLAILWGFGVLFLVVLIVALMLARDVPPIAKLGLTVLILMLLTGLFLYTVPRMSPKKVVPRLDDLNSLIQRSTAGDASERRAAVNGLANNKTPRAIRAIRQVLEHDTDDEVRAEAAIALGRSGDREAIPLLLQVLSRERWRVAAACATALGYLGDGSVIPDLERTILTGDWLMGQKALQSIARLGNGDPMLIPVFIRAMGNGSNFVVDVAIQALTGDYSNGALQPLIDLLDSPSGDVRLNVAKALGGFTDPRAKKALQNRLSEETDEWVLKQLNQSLQQLAT